MKKVLIADDSAFMRSVIRRLLEKQGFTVAAEAENGAVCIEQYKLHKPDIVTMDVTMSGMDGIQALQALMELDPAAKVIMISSLGQESVIRTAISLGARSFIVKPFTEAHVAAVLKEVMGR
jgi:two-component system chemotaxis response regulator CheY